MSDHSSSRSACENAVWPYSDDSSATTTSVTASASAATAGFSWNELIEHSVPRLTRVLG
jgi:hypothetical protein